MQDTVLGGENIMTPYKMGQEWQNRQREDAELGWDTSFHFLIN